GVPVSSGLVLSSIDPRPLQLAGPATYYTARSFPEPAIAADRPRLAVLKARTGGRASAWHSNSAFFWSFRATRLGPTPRHSLNPLPRRTPPNAYASTRSGSPNYTSRRSGLSPRRRSFSPVPWRHARVE